ncbi:Hsp20/alpha crystallin family protein [Cryptosporangium arvum]|uniref:Molecular chaperone (Small heat shock protein) n=1 Tax=Cryptosporangium arvum DSM 44712 TaxID=927661 RepID=A0A010ZS44_9ACTN|nr:Hsp20/alpha crystallin family protein [Cryptosporangium arvum]EXG81489.1 molecular chaperone (small heat shock protein) [Cryptosporangium arvum DSM 44712]
MSITLWTRRDPFAEFDALVRRSFGPVATRPAETRRNFTPAAEVTRDGDDAVVRLEVPGVDVENDVTVEVDAGQLVVRGERRGEHDGRSFSEVRYGSFRRTFRLPEHVGADAVTASYDQGVLSVRVAGAHTAPAQPETRRIAITTAPAAESPTESPAASTVDHTA